MESLERPAHAPSQGFFDSSTDETFFSMPPEPSKELSAPTNEDRRPPSPTQSTIAGATHHEEGRAPIAPVSLFRMLTTASDKWDVLLMIVGSLAAVCFGLVQPCFFIFFGRMVNDAGRIAQDSKALAQELTKLAFYMFTMSSSLILSAWIESTTWMYTAEQQVCKLRYGLLKAILYQDIEFFDTESKTAQIIGVMSSDITTIHEVIGFKVGKFVRFSTTFFAATSVGLYYCWQLALLTFATVPITTVLTGVYSKAAVKHAAKIQAAIARSASVIEETTSQIRTIYSYTSESRQFQKFMDALTEKCRLGETGGLVKGLGLGALLATFNLSWAMLLWFGGILITKHLATQAGSIITSIFCIIYAGQALGTAMECLQRFADGKMSTARVFELMNKKASIMNMDEGYKLYNVSGEIVLQNVSFRYKSRPNVLVLDNVSLEIPAGKTLALVGSSGSGKSTIISLIERYYDPDKGEISFDGISLKSLNLKWMRTQIGLVGQEPVLFATSIMENLLYAKKDATMAEIEAASKAANAHSFIVQLPCAYQTQVGEGGLQLSGGQRQRLAIARAILKNPSILLLDEATSALDTQSERLIQEALEGFMQSRTTVVVAHRLSTIRNADKIVLLQNGRVAETGSHESLIKLGPTGAYYSLLQSQDLGTYQKKRLEVGSNENEPSRSNSTTPARRHIHRQSPRISFSSSIMGTPISPYLSTSIHMSVPNEDTLETSKNIEKYDGEKYDTKQTLVPLSRKLFSSKKKQMALAILSGMCSGATMPLFLYFIFEVCIAYIDGDQSSRDRRIQHVLLLLVLLAILSFFSNLLQHLYFAKIGEFIVKDVMERMFRALMLKQVSWYDKEQNNSGALTEAFLQRISPINSFVTEFASSVVKTISIFCACIGLAFKASWPIALLILAIMPVVTFGALQRNKDVKCTHSKGIKTASVNANIIAGEAVNNIRTVASLAAEEEILGQFKDSLQAPLKKNAKNSISIGCMIALGNTALLFSVCFIMYISAVLVGARKVSFLRCLQALQVLSYTAESLAEALSITPIMESASKAFRKIASVIERTADEEPQNHGPETTVQGRIEFAKVMFAYPSRPGSLVLRDFNLEVPAGKTVAIVGRSGSGKSSILALLQRFYQPQSGSIKLDGVDISTLGVKWLRQRMALVQQQPALFTTTIEENIRYGREDATETEVREAAKLANADGFVSALPEGYKTHVGNKGVKLSGGQKQRIAIARAVLKQGKVLLLDEATSALDAETEENVQEALECVVALTGATVLVVAHRLATVRSAHLIAVVEHGRVAELGSHALLIRRPLGLYAQLVRLQKPDMCST